MNQRKISARLSRRGEEEQGFNREFWQAAGPESIFAAAWEMVREVNFFRGQDVSQSRLQRSVQKLKRRKR